MATVFRKTYTKPLPENAEVRRRKGECLARWKDAKGRARTARVTNGRDGSQRIRIEATTFTAKYRDGNGIVLEESTGCRTKDGALAVLKTMLGRSEQVRSGLLTNEECVIADHQASPLSTHFEAFLDYKQAAGVTPVRIKTLRQRFEQVSAACHWRKLSDLGGDPLVGWLVARVADDMSAGSRNGYREACVVFGNWCRQTHRLAENPFINVPKADQRIDQRRKRRSLTEAEIESLVKVARQRPLLEALTIRRGPRRGRPEASVRPETKQRLLELGWERALIYKTLVLTGLRKGELASLTVGSLRLDAKKPYAVLAPANEKTRRGSDIPLRADLVGDLAEWLNHKLIVAQEAARRRNTPVPVRLPADEPLFRVPAGLVRILDRDLKLAGIPKRDELGRTIDVHAMRHTFGTHLSKGNIGQRTTQAAMRHSDPRLTANVYTDPHLLDVAGALDVLPRLDLSGIHGSSRERATGTDAVVALAPTLAPNPRNRGTPRANTDGCGGLDRVTGEPSGIARNPCLATENDPLPHRDNGSQVSGRQDSNLRPLRPERSALARLSHAPCYSFPTRSLRSIRPHRRPFARGERSSQAEPRPVLSAPDNATALSRICKRFTSDRYCLGGTFRSRHADDQQVVTRVYARGHAEPAKNKDAPQINARSRSKQEWDHPKWFGRRIHVVVRREQPRRQQHDRHHRAVARQAHQVDQHHRRDRDHAEPEHEFLIDTRTDTQNSAGDPALIRRPRQPRVQRVLKQEQRQRETKALACDPRHRAPAYPPARAARDVPGQQNRHHQQRRKMVTARPK